jgi:putative transcriptional regulator
VKQYWIRLKLKELLEKRGMTQKELAEKAHLREAAVSELARDIKTVYNKEHLEKIMEVLNVTSVDDIFEIVIIDKEKTSQ